MGQAPTQAPHKSLHAHRSHRHHHTEPTEPTEFVTSINNTIPPTHRSHRWIAMVAHSVLLSRISSKILPLGLLIGLIAVDGFGGIASDARFGANHAVASAKSTTLLNMATEASVQSDSSPSHMFHDYDKPIVLIGCSSAANEIDKLAGSVKSLMAGASIIRPTEQSQDDIVQSIQDGTYGWPNVIVLDYTGDGAEAAASDATESSYSSLVKTLYEDLGMMSVFVNVDPASSNMESGAAGLKQRLEEEVFVRYSDFEVCIKDEGSMHVDTDGGRTPWEHIEWELARILARSRLPSAIPGSETPTANTANLMMGDNTFFLSLSFPQITDVEPYVQEMCRDVDAMEYRTDLLDCRDSRFDLLYSMQLLRRYCRPYTVRVPALPFGEFVMEDVMPIVYTVRTQNQAGTYPDDEAGISKMFDLLEWGLRAGVEVLDVESAWDAQKTDDLLALAKGRYASQILGSHHVVGKEISTEEAVDLYKQCALDGRAHGAKVVLSIEDKAKDRMAHEAALLASSLAQSDGRPVIPNISLVLGDIGRFSRIINLPFTPVTHESLPFKAAPGQMTANEIMAARILMKIVLAKKFVILGHNIAYSVSPQMQGAAFAMARLPYQYGRADVEKVEEFTESEFFKSIDFGGCSVTIPHKQAVMPYVDILTDAAKTIGSVNTLIVEEDINPRETDEVNRIIRGDNTDWKGIRNPLQRIMGASSIDASKDVALILGGGGTARAAAYAANQLGLKSVYYNRTPSKAADLAETFGGQVVGSLEDAASEADSDYDSLKDILASIDNANIRVVISTLPAAAEFVLPDWIIESFKPIIFDVNYKPFTTKLLEQAEDADCTVVRGSEMLWEQGVGQFEAWTKRTAPYGVMRAMVLENCLPPVEGEEGEEEEEDTSQ